jgi:cytochrome c peroxidase
MTTEDQVQPDEAKIELGRFLFYETALSIDSSVSCGSCHAQTHAFADHNSALSSGFKGRLGKRNSPALSNLAWAPNMMWDGGITHLEVMSFAPLTDTNEMASDVKVVVQRLKADPQYVSLFENAYGAVSEKNMYLALAQFMTSLISDQSRYDSMLRGEVVFNDIEQNGYELFQTNCASCHVEPLMSDFDFASNGLELQENDAGRGKVTQQDEDFGTYRIPSLRNVTLTYPYMHDGRIYQLEDVINHYSDGVQMHRNLDNRLPSPLHLTEPEKEALLNFLMTLTDETYLANPAFSEPR